MPLEEAVWEHRVGWWTPEPGKQKPWGTEKGQGIKELADRRQASRGHLDATIPGGRDLGPSEGLLARSL